MFTPTPVVGRMIGSESADIVTLRMLPETEAIVGSVVAVAGRDRL